MLQSARIILPFAATVAALCLAGALAAFLVYPAYAQDPPSCPNPTPTAVAVDDVPIVVTSTTADYFVLYVSHDVDGTEVELPVLVRKGAAGTTTLAENIEALPAERYRVEKYLIASPADVDGDCIDDITELDDFGTKNPVNAASSVDLDDGAVGIPDRATLKTLSSGSGANTYLKFVLLGYNTDNPLVYFVNTTTHGGHNSFYTEALGIEKEGTGYVDNGNGVITYHRDIRSANGGLGVYTIWIYRITPFSEVDRIYTLLAASMPVLEDNLAYNLGNYQLLSTQDDLPLYEESRINVMFDKDLAPESDVIPLNQAEGYGLLRHMDPDERPNPRDVVVYETLPNNLPRVAGIISTVPQTPLSHVNLRAIQDGVPNAFIRGALDDPQISALIGKHVHYAVGEKGYTIRAATSTEIDDHYASSRPAQPQTPERDLLVTEITPLSNIGFDDWDAFGVKAANVAVLGKLAFPEGTVPGGFAIPFYFYDEFMKHNDFYTRIQTMLDDAEFQTKFDTQESELKKLRKDIEDAETPEWIIEAIETMNTGFPAGINRRYRSSTNNEDLPGFNGAGLYDSKSQKPSEDEEDLAKSLKEVYASLWNFRAFTEREFHRINHLKAAMGVLVHPSYQNELVNGVAVSFDPTFGRKGRYYVNSQVGEDLVTNPDAHSVPEELLLRPPFVLATSNQAAPGQLLMSQDQMDQLGQHLTVIHNHFKELYGPGPDEPYAMEIEFKITSANMLAIKQARPWVFGGAAKDTPPSPDSAGTVTLSSSQLRVASALTATLTDPDGDISNMSWQWASSLNGSSNWATISGAASATYMPAAADVGKYLRATASYTDGHGPGKTAMAVSANPVIDGSPPPPPPPPTPTPTPNDSPGVSVSLMALTVVEEDPTGDSYTVALHTPPTADVTVTVAGHAGTDVTPSPATLTFTSLNWATAQTVTVTAANDADATDDTVTLTHSATSTDTEYDAIAIAGVAVTVNDNDTRGVTVTPMSLSVNEGGTNTYTVVLDTEPTDTVTVTISSNNTDVTVSSSPLTFSTSNWATAQTVTVSADEDDDSTRDTATVTHTVAGGDYDSFAASSVSVTVTDNDTPGGTVTPLLLTVGEGGTGRYTVVLTTLPTGNVTVAISSNNTDVTASSSTLTFTTANWNSAQTVTVSAGQDDDATNDMATLTHNPSGADYNSVSNAILSVTVTDDDTRGVTVTPMSLSVNEGGTNTYTVVLDTEPTDTVTVTIVDPTDNTDVTANPASLRFSTSNWATAQTVTVSADEDADPTQDTATVTHTVAGGDYASFAASSVAVTVTDNDTPGVTVTPMSLTVTEGATGRYTVRLNTLPTGNVLVAISSNNTDVTVSSSTLTFTTTSWSTEQTVTVSAGQDADAANDMATLTHNPSGANYGSVSNAILMVTVTDDDTAGLELSVTFLDVDEGGQNTYTVKLDTQPTTTVTVTVSSGDTGAATVDGSTLRFTTSNWNTAQTVTVRGVNDGDSTDETVTVTNTASGGEYAGVTETVTVTVDDDDTNPPPPPPPPVVGGGFGAAFEAPQFVDGFRTSRPLEETARVGDAVGDPVAATHPRNSEITYSLSGADAALFTVDEETGQIRLGQALPLALGQSYAVNLTATDSSGTGAIIIVVIEVAEAPYHRYDLNKNGSIEKDEVLAAVADYFAARIEKPLVLEVVSLYFAA